MQLQELINTKNSQILEHKLALELTDYKATRVVEGYELDNEIIAEREAHREAIRLLEPEIIELERELEVEKAVIENEINWEYQENLEIV